MKAVTQAAREQRPGAQTPEDQDASLVERVALGDQAAFRLLYDRYSGHVMAIALRVLRNTPAAEEVVQETFLELWSRGTEFHRARAPLGTWLFVISRSRALDSLRRDARRAGRERAGIPPAHATQDLTMLDADALNEALSRLPAEQRAAVKHAFLDQWSHSEIATRLQTPLGTVKTRIRTALANLSELLCDPPHAGEE